MNFKEVMEKLKDNSFSSPEERANTLKQVRSRMSILSKNSLINFQKESLLLEKDYDKFVIAQNEEFYSCIEIELSELGELVRIAEGLKPVKMEDSIYEFSRELG